MKPQGGVKNMTKETAGKEPDFHTRSIHNDIEAKKFPNWTVFAQIIDPRKAESLHINIFDSTKTLPLEHFPLRQFGRIVLDKNVDNIFAGTEQSAFSPTTNILPGWALSPDPSKYPLSTMLKDGISSKMGVHSKSCKPGLSPIQRRSDTG
jgi:catalase